MVRGENRLRVSEYSYPFETLSETKNTQICRDIRNQIFNLKWYNRSVIVLELDFPDQSDFDHKISFELQLY